MSTEELLTLSGTVILTGFVVVFAALIILIICVNVMGKIINAFAGKSKPSAPPPPAPKTAAAPPPPAAAAQDDDVIAVISAAVGAYMDQAAPGVPYAVTGIAPGGVSRSKDLRPVWGFAGMRQNTEPF